MGRRLAPGRLGTLLLLLTVAATAAPPPADAAPLVHVSVLHRHGARMAPVFEGGQLTWAYAMLTAPGAVMARRLGDALRARYVGTRVLPVVLPAEHEEIAVRSRSTGVARTVQTAFGVRRRLVRVAAGGPAGDDDGAVANVPMVHHRAAAADTLLRFPGSWPSWGLRGRRWLAFTADNARATAVLGAAGVATLVAELSPLYPPCADQLMNCALLGQDVAQCRRSNGGLSAALASIYPQLETIQRLSVQTTFHYDPTNATAPDHAAGAYGHPLLAAWAADAATAVSRYEAGAPPLDDAFAPLRHYSAHDTTLSGVLLALGNATFAGTAAGDALWVPTFGQAIVAETYADRTMAFVLLTNSQTAATNFSYTAQPLLVACATNADPAVPRAAIAVEQRAACPVGNFSAALRRFAATVPRPECFLSPADAALCRGGAGGGGGAAATHAPADVRAACAAWRRRCPTEACAAGAFVDAATADAACVPLPAPLRAARFVGAVAAGAVVCAAVGAAVGAVARSVAGRRRAPKRRALDDGGGGDGGGDGAAEAKDDDRRAIVEHPA